MPCCHSAILRESMGSETHKVELSARYMNHKHAIHTHHLFTTNSEALLNSNVDTRQLRLVKKAELAKCLSVCEREIDDWRQKKLIPFIRISPRCIRYDVADVIDDLKRKFQINSKDRRIG